MMGFIQQTELLAEIRKRQLPLEKQAAYYKLTCPPYIMHIANTKRVTRVHLKGFEGVNHRGIAPVSTDQARASHLGRVSGQLDFSQPPEIVFDAFCKCLDLMCDVSKVPAASSLVIQLKLDGDLLGHIDHAATQIAAGVPPGIEITREDAIRFLLHQAIKRTLWDDKKGEHR